MRPRRLGEGKVVKVEDDFQCRDNQVPFGPSNITKSIFYTENTTGGVFVPFSANSRLHRAAK